MSEIEDEAFGSEVAGEVTVLKKIKVEPTWYCIHCQEPVPKRVATVYQGMRVCPESDCIRAVIFEDRYSDKYERPKEVERVCGRCGRPKSSDPCVE